MAHPDKVLAWARCIYSMNATGFQEAETGGGREREGGNNEQPNGVINDPATVRSTGGVKALLKQLNSKYSDSHVQLPDGTVPGGKPVSLVRSKTKPGGLGGSNGNENSLPKSGDGGGGASGVKARLAEINSKHKNSFVRLPDGTVPAKPVELLRPRSKESNDEPGIFLEQEESASVSAYDGYEENSTANYANHGVTLQQGHDSQEHNIDILSKSQPRPPAQAQVHAQVEHSRQHLESQDSAASTLYSDYVQPTSSGGGMVVGGQSQPLASSIPQVQAQQTHQEGYSDYSAVAPPPVYPPNFPPMKPAVGGVHTHMDARQQQHYMMEQRRVNPPAAPPLLNQPSHMYAHPGAQHHGVRD